MRYGNSATHALVICASRRACIYVASALRSASQRNNGKIQCLCAFDNSIPAEILFMKKKDIIACSYTCNCSKSCTTVLGSVSVTCSY